MLKFRAQYAGVLAAAAAPVYFVIQLLFGAEADESVVRTLWFFGLVFLVSLAVKWEKKEPPPPS